MRVINMFGGPGSGKSTTAASVFALLKQRGYNAELVTEFAKDLTWHDRKSCLKDQIYIFVKQQHRLFMLKDKVDFIVTDTPLLSGIHFKRIYAPTVPESFIPLVIDTVKQYDNINIFLKRSKAYNPKGHNETEEDARKIDDGIYSLFKEFDIDFEEYPTNGETAESIVGSLTESCNCGNKATYMYMPSGGLQNPYYCNLCVPRGCSCNQEKDDNTMFGESPPVNGQFKWIDEEERIWERVDDKGRLYPCVEYTELMSEE